MASNNDIVSKMSFVQEKVQVNNKRGFDIDLNVALSEEENEIVEEEKSSVIVDSDEERFTKNKRWETLLDVSEVKLLEYEQKGHGKTSLTRKKRVMTRGVDEFGSGSTRKNKCYYNNNSNDDCVVVRSTRGRAVALPNKFRDSVLEPVAEFPQVTRTGKRKSRLSWNTSK